MNWGVLFANHRKRVPDAIYHEGCRVTGLEENGDDSLTVQLEDGRHFAFDLVVFADGYHSWGRSYLYPEAKMEYAGYVIWRGLIPESLAPDGVFETASEWGVHDGGLYISYMIPGQHGETEPGTRLVNWAWYNLVPKEQLAELLTDRHGNVHTTSLPQGAATEAHVTYIHNRAREMLRGVAADVVCATAEPFVQVIYDMHVPSYARGHVCLIGDASSIARPHTGAGAIKAQQQAIALSKALSEHDALDPALEAWNAEVWTAGDKQVNLGKVLGRALVTEAPDWGKMDPMRMEKWWKDATSGVYVYYFDDADEQQASR
jgi:2-polyprenyl-6-methoxyphenol hydroxylase-like FAD-dependent oxidoreductase